MHEHEGVFCKTGKSWDNAKIAELETKHLRAESCWANNAQERGLGASSPMGLGPASAMGRLAGSGPRARRSCVDSSGGECGSRKQIGSSACGWARWTPATRVVEAEEAKAPGQGRVQGLGKAEDHGNGGY